MNAEREFVRRQYLSALGVRPWYARCRMPLGTDLLWPDVYPVTPESPPASPQSGPQTADAVAQNRPLAVSDAAYADSQPKAAVSLLNQAATTTPEHAGTEFRSSESSPGESAPEPSSLQTGQGIEFKQCWWARDGWLIVDTRAANIRPEQQRQADRLMAALAQALCGERKPTQAYRIDWPLFVNRSIKHDTEEARFYLQQKWQAVQQQAPVQRLVMLGDQTPDLLGLAPDTPGSRYWKQGDLVCCLGPATSEMLHLPAAKRALWQTLTSWLSETSQ